MAKIQSVKLTDLLVNTENYRFEPVSSQKEAIDKMVEEQNDKLLNLAEHILIHGLNPNDKIQVSVSNHDNTKFNVLEGNRRVVSLKLLNNPELIDSSAFASLKKKFKKLNDDNKSKLPKQVECTIYDNPAEADKWIKLKHAGLGSGVGTADWNALQVQRFEEKVEGKSSIAIQTINVLKKSNDVPDSIKNSLAKLPVTNLDRLLSDPDVRDMLGVEINGGIIQTDLAEKEVVKGLVQVAKHLLDPKFNVKKIYTKDDRRDYIKKFPTASKPDLTKKASKPWQFNGSKAASAPSKSASKVKATPNERSVLIPKSCIMGISNPKVNSMYHELQKIDVQKFPNTVAVSFRVFIELSMDSYIEKHKLATTPSSAKSGTDFQQKVFQVANHLETKKAADATICKGIRTAIKDKNDIMSIDTWHAYVHNNRLAAKASNLIITWNNIQDFITILWANV